MRITETLAVLALLIAGAAQAADVDAPLLGGTVEVHFGSATANPDALATASIGVRPAGGGSLVFCADVDAAGEVQGSTVVVAATAPTVLLEGVSFSDAGCTGIESVPSTDLYRIVFAGPGPPILIRGD